MFSRILVLILFLFPGHILFSKGKPVKAENGMAVSASSYASEVGVQIMKEGGNAIDAAVAVGFMLAVTYPSAGNIGGGGFMVIHFADGRNITLDFREKAPQNAHRDIYLDENGNYDEKLSQEGFSSSGVPGSVAGLIYALEKYGTMPLEQVLMPAIKIAEAGFEIGYEMAESINFHNEEFNKYESSKKIFTANGNKLPDNHLLIQRDLANSLRRILDEGVSGFYEGKTAELLIEQSRKSNGLLTAEDLKKYKVVERKPVEGNYKGYDIISMGPPSSGGIALIESLNTLEHLEFTKEEWGSSRYIHYLVEILKRVYADRNQHIGDSDFYPVPVSLLISKIRGRDIFESIGYLTIPSDDILPLKLEDNESRETTHYSIIDSKGNAVSVTTTINSAYGNKIIVDGAGFLMNNEMDDFSAKPGVPNQYGLVGSLANSIESGKRMLSSMTPTIVTNNGKPVLILGSPGGSTIITAVLQVIINVLDFKMNIWEAINAPRIHHQHYPDRIDYEEFGISSETSEKLKSLGHQMGIKTILGCVEGIFIDDNKTIWGATDPRGYGKAVGY